MRSSNTYERHWFCLLRVCFLECQNTFSFNHSFPETLNKHSKGLMKIYQCSADNTHSSTLFPQTHSTFSCYMFYSLSVCSSLTQVPVCISVVRGEVHWEILQHTADVGNLSPNLPPGRPPPLEQRRWKELLPVEYRFAWMAKENVKRLTTKMQQKRRHMTYLS